MFLKKVGVFLVSLVLILNTVSISRAEIINESNNKYQPTIVLSGDVDINSFFTAGWGSRLRNKIKKAAKKIKDKIKDIVVDKPIDTVKEGVDHAVDTVQDGIEITKDTSKGDFGELKEDLEKDFKDDVNDFKDAVKEPIDDTKKDINDTKDIFSGGGSNNGSEEKDSKDDSKSGSGDGSGDNGGSGSDSGSGNLPGSDPGLTPGGSGGEGVPSNDQLPTDQNGSLTNPFDDLNFKLMAEKDRVLNSFSIFNELKQERISKLIILVGDRRAVDIDNGIQNISGKFSNLLSRIIDFNLNIVRGSKNFFISNPDPSTEKEIVLKLRFAMEQVRNSNSLINSLRENYLYIVDAQSEDDLKVRYEKNLKPLFIKTSSSIKDTYSYIEKIANLMRGLSQGK